MLVLTIVVQALGKYMSLKYLDPQGSWKVQTENTTNNAAATTLSVTKLKLAFSILVSLHFCRRHMQGHLLVGLDNRKLRPSADLCCLFVGLACVVTRVVEMRLK